MSQPWGGTNTERRWQKDPGATEKRRSQQGLRSATQHRGTGADTSSLKWKPPSENSIDFQLHLRFPPSAHNPSEPDFTQKPAFLLFQWLGSSGSRSEYEFFDYLEMSDQAWEEIKESGEQYDERVVEVCWDKTLGEFGNGSWRIMRFRDDKPHGNHKSIVGKILTSIKDGVELDVVSPRSCLFPYDPSFALDGVFPVSPLALYYRP